MSDRLVGWKIIAVVAGGLALLGILTWQAIRFWMIYSKDGGTGPLIGGVVCSLLLLGWIILAIRMLI